jgi:hypothetical protein
MGQTRISLCLILVFLVSLVAGCEEKTNPVSKVGDRLIGAYERSSVTAGQSTLKGIKDAIRAYHISNGEYPDSIEEVQRYMGARIDTGLYQYDPDSGEISLLE